MWCCTKGSQQVVDQCQVKHFFQSDAANRCAPSIDGFFFPAVDAFVFVTLETPLRIEISTHDGVFEFCCLGQQENQLFSIVYDQVKFFIHMIILSFSPVLLGRQKICLNPAFQARVLTWLFPASRARKVCRNNSICENQWTG